MIKTFRNLDKADNCKLARQFAYLLKANDECSPAECNWVALTIFDHWLHEDNRYSIIRDATVEQKQQWDQRMRDFLQQLATLDSPVQVKFRGRHSKPRLQFSAYTGAEPAEVYLSGFYDSAYPPKLVLPALKTHFWLESDWTIYLVYQNIADVIPLCKLVGAQQLYLLPVFSVGQLNQYSALAIALRENGLDSVLYQPAAKGDV